MKLPEVRTAIYGNLERVLGPHSFKLNKSREAFVRLVPEGKQSIYVSIVDLDPSFELSIVVGLRVDAVEKIAHLFSGAQEKYQSLSETVIVQLNYFTSDDPSEFVVSSIQEIEFSASKLEKLLSEKVLPLMDECQDLTVLEAKVNSRNGSFNSAQPPYSALTSLALSHIANPSAFDHLASEAIASVAHFPQQAQQQVQGLISYLKESHAL